LTAQDTALGEDARYRAGAAADLEDLRTGREIEIRQVCADHGLVFGSAARSSITSATRACRRAVRPWRRHRASRTFVMR